MPHGKASVRQTAVSYDGKTILACCDDASICRWDLVPGSSAEGGVEDADVVRQGAWHDRGAFDDDAKADGMDADVPSGDDSDDSDDSQDRRARRKKRSESG